MTNDPESIKDMAQALLVAARHSRIDIVRYLLQKSPKILQVETAEGIELWKQAITEGLSNVYEVSPCTTLNWQYALWLALQR